MDDQQSLDAIIRAQIVESQQAHAALESLIPDIMRAVEALIKSYRAGGKLVVFGNGGSAADAQHIAAEMLGRFKLERPAWPAIALTTNSSAMTAISNDYGYENVFERQVEAWVGPDDTVLGISTSGKSANVLKGLAKARALGACTIALVGNHTTTIEPYADIVLAVPSENTPRIQEIHILIGHLICEFTERALIDPPFSPPHI